MWLRPMGLVKWQVSLSELFHIYSNKNFVCVCVWERERERERERKREREADQWKRITELRVEKIEGCLWYKTETDRRECLQMYAKDRAFTKGCWANGLCWWGGSKGEFYQTKFGFGKGWYLGLWWRVSFQVYLSNFLSLKQYLKLQK